MEKNIKWVNIKWVIMRMCGKQIVHFLHIGKTGGTALRLALRLNLLTEKYVIVSHYHDFRLRDVPKGDKVVFFIRDPVSRFVSSFNSRIREGRPRYNMLWSPNEKIAFDQFKTANELAKALSSDEETIRTAAIRAMKSIYHVKHPFWTWFDSESYFLSRLPDILFIGSQETLSSDFLALKKKLGLPNDVKLPSDDIMAHRTPPCYDTHLEEEAIDNLRSWYKRDYDFVRLCKELMNKGLF